MSNRQTRSTKSNRIKQEEEGDVRLDEASPTPPRPPTSFLDLPNDILHSILEEFYEGRYESITPTTPLRIAEILVSKRIYLLALPLWYKRLSISEQQLDVRLAGLLENTARASRIVDLGIHLTNSHANLAKLAISRLSRLSSITIHLQDELTDANIALLAQSITTVDTLRDLTISSSRGRSALIRRFSSHCSTHYGLQSNFRKSFDVGGMQFFSKSKRDGAKMYKYRFSEVRTGITKKEWLAAHTFDFGARSPPGAGIIKTLIEAAEEQHSRSTDNNLLPLERIAMDLQFRPEDEDEPSELFTPNQFGAFFVLLLQCTGLRQLDLRQVDELPPVSGHFSSKSLQLLRLSGSYTLRSSHNFRNLLSLLETFPALVQLHLVGHIVFGVGDDEEVVEELSKLQGSQLSFSYPELDVLLKYLRQSQVLIFTYRNPEQRREVRWTKLTAEDEFDRDCWTL